MKLIHKEGIIVSRLKYSETSMILGIFSKDNGLVKGLYRGALSKKNNFLVQLGNIVDFSHKVRLENQLGSLELDYKSGVLPYIFDDNNKLLAISTVCNVINSFFLENDKNEYFYEATKFLILSLAIDNWITKYIKWELILLKTLGFGISYDKCYVCSAKDNLRYISPKTGNSVCAEHGELYKDKLLKIPKFLVEDVTDISSADIKEALDITSYYLSEFCIHSNKSLPIFREKLIKNYL